MWNFTEEKVLLGFWGSFDGVKFTSLGVVVFDVTSCEAVKQKSEVEPGVKIVTETITVVKETEQNLVLSSE